MSNKALLSNVYFEGVRRYLRFVDVFFFLSFEKLYNKSYFEAGRRPRKRSLLFVNEHFEGKPDAERALLDSFFFIGVMGAISVIDL